jgi:cation diffusion facilitator family transporter
MSGSDSKSHIVQSLIINMIIAAVKFAAAFFTKSGSMLAEAVHSFADCGNQLLLLWGLNRSSQPPDERHPLGYGRASYFYAFIVALLLFTLGGVFSVYEGVHKLMHPEPASHLGWAMGILGFSLLLEGYATYGNMKSINEKRQNKPFFQYLKDTKDSDLVVVFAENSAAVLGLAVALVAIILTEATGQPAFDAVGSLLVGLVLIGVAVFLFNEMKSLLVGEAADPDIRAAAHDIAARHPRIDKVLGLITMQQGPGEVVLAIKLKMSGGLSGDQLVDAINEFERELQSQRPEVKWLFAEPDNDNRTKAAERAAAEQSHT